MVNLTPLVSRISLVCCGSTRKHHDFAPRDVQIEIMDRASPRGTGVGVPLAMTRVAALDRTASASEAGKTSPGPVRTSRRRCCRDGSTGWRSLSVGSFGFRNGSTHADLRARCRAAGRAKDPAWPPRDFGGLPEPGSRASGGAARWARAFPAGLAPGKREWRAHRPHWVLRRRGSAFGCLSARGLCWPAQDRTPWTTTLPPVGPGLRRFGRPHQARHGERSPLPALPACFIVDPNPRSAAPSARCTSPMTKRCLVGRSG